ncbi:MULTISPECIES: DUF2569 domain-containing protein [Kosakonia]|uniref:DUF2569 domain-containing protein n=1 Tax=Kosakonia TaxID=1330547 RepID=UPI002ACEEB77|nr:DUF2569 domain-containing protein [Kosakonia sacchari]MDZ7322702.1 DUF2569 domain-containing protein [Kosakonia sacchari]
MGICIQCDKEALKESDFCAECEAREFKKIRGWLFVPAIGLVLSLLSVIVSFSATLKVVMEHYSVLVGGQKGMLVFELVFYGVMFAYTVFVGSLFFRKKRLLPRFYIGFLLLWIAFHGVDVWLAHQVFDVPYVYDTVSSLLRSVISAAIWIPYFVVSERVKRTFVR